MRPLTLPCFLLRLSLLGAVLATPTLAMAQTSAQKQPHLEPGAQRIQSAAQQVALVELFTSEGCSSCPPADAWMSELKDDPRLWKSLVPVAFHVDYWDYIGWPDRFASPTYSNRHRDYARYAGLRSVYTPGFLVRGKEWQGWFRYPTLNLDSPPPAGVITLDIAADGRRVNARYVAAAHSPGPLEVHLAVLGFDLQTKVAAGENDGRILHHDFVVLGYQRVPMQGDTPRFAATTTLPEQSVDSPRRALAAWVSRLKDPTPLQAVGDWLAR